LRQSGICANGEEYHQRDYDEELESRHPSRTAPQKPTTKDKKNAQEAPHQWLPRGTCPFGEMMEGWRAFPAVDARCDLVDYDLSAQINPHAEPCTWRRGNPRHGAGVRATVRWFIWKDVGAS